MITIGPFIRDKISRVRRELGHLYKLVLRITYVRCEVMYKWFVS